MSTIQFLIDTEDGASVLTLVIPGDPKSPYIARDDHPNFKAIVGAAMEREFEDIASLFDVADTIALKFQRLSERVTVENDTVYFDGVAVDSALTQQILAVLNSGADGASWTALVNFFEKVQQNPSEDSRAGLYVWIKAHNGLTISDDGDIVGYKAVNSDDEHGYRSISGGKEPVRVNDVVYTGRIPNPLGATVEMARDLVDPSSVHYCSVGLHVGTWDYAKSFGGCGGTVLEVRVNPRDVVAVPEDSSGQKVRTCRYTVVGPVTAKYSQPVLVIDAAPDPEPDPFAPFTVGTRVTVLNTDYTGKVVPAPYDGFGKQYVPVRLDDGNYVGGWYPKNLTVIEDLDLAPANEGRTDLHAKRTNDCTPACKTGSGGVHHGRGGATSVAAKGHGKNPAQDALGRFSGGRPGSTRDRSTGRFA